MTMSPTNSSSLELTISMPGLSSSPSLPSSVERLYGVRDLDINQVPVGEGGGGGGGGGGDDQEWVTGGMEDEEEITINGGPPRKKLRLSKEQSRLLEESFRQHHTLNPRQKEELASQLKLRPRQVEVWFQNRRARSKLKQTEMECEYLKRWFGSLTEQNKRLQREVEELRAMKVGPPTVMSPHCCEPLLASTLSMCPRCEGVTTATNKTGPARSVATTSVVVETAVVALLDNVKAQGSDRSNRRMIVD